jgi:predicted nucleotidyltransferase
MKRISPEAFQAELDKVLLGLRQYAPEKVWLFGSFARGDYHAGSDIDLLIVKRTARPFLERSAEVLRLCACDLSLEPLVYTLDEIRDMVQRGNPFITRALREKWFMDNNLNEGQRQEVFAGK